MKYLILMFAILCSFSVFGQTNLIGTWDTKEDNTKIVITESEGNITGKIKSSDNPKAAIDKIVLKDLKINGDHWTAKIYAAKRQRWYNAELQLTGDVLEIEISVGLLSKTVEWNKEKEI